MDSMYSKDLCSLHMRREARITQTECSCRMALTTLYCGISLEIRDHSKLVIALAIRDMLYLRGFHDVDVTVDIGNGRDAVADIVIEYLTRYERENMVKFVGCGIPTTVIEYADGLFSRLWLELDIIPIVIPAKSQHGASCWMAKPVDEQADSMARKCIVHFGPCAIPRLQVGWHGAVQVSLGGKARLVGLHDYKQTCSPASWETMSIHADSMRRRGTKMAFFSATPQGEQMASERHALIRFSELLGLNVTWYVPKPRKEVYRIANDIQDILRDATKPQKYLQANDKTTMLDWITDNAKRYWLVEGGPLRSPEEGGADIVIIDDPQMAGLIPLAKAAKKDRPVLYRSHIPIRADLVAEPGTSQNVTWGLIWDLIKDLDAFISHPIPESIPPMVPWEKTAYLPAASDWLDGLNKKMNMWDTGFYMHNYNAQCYKYRMTELDWPAHKYIIEISRFYSSEDLLTVIGSYTEFRRLIDQTNVVSPPQLVICGNGFVGDSARKLVYDQAVAEIETRYPYLKHDISMIRLDESDRLLNVLMRNAHAVLHVASSEGFEITVSAALHAGRPVIASRSGGNMLQIQDGVNGFLVQPGDQQAVAEHLLHLSTDKKLYKKMSIAARIGLSDEITTVGNALAWYYLASKFVADPRFKCNGRWVNDMARKEAGKLYSAWENRLSRLSKV